MDGVNNSFGTDIHGIKDNHRDRIPVGLIFDVYNCTSFTLFYLKNLNLNLWFIKS